MSLVPLNGAAAPLLKKLSAALRRHDLDLDAEARATVESPAFLSVCARLSERQALFAMLYVATFDPELAHDVSGLGVRQVDGATKLVIKAGLASRKDTLDLANHELAFELAAIAMCNIADIPPEVYQTGDITRLPRHITAAIKKIKPVRDAGFEVELYDKLKAMQQLDAMFVRAQQQKEDEQASRRRTSIRLVSSNRLRSN